MSSDATTYDVRIHKTDVYTSRTKGGRNTYWVRWKVAGTPFKRPFGTAALAESFRSELLTSARKGEAFRVPDGLPVSTVRTDNEVSWFDFACQYMDMKWPAAAATYRRSLSEALTAMTPALLTSSRGRPDDAATRAALHRWAFNSARRGSEAPSQIADALRWLAVNTRPVAALSDPIVLRSVLSRISVRLDGKPAAGSVVSKRRRVLFNVVEYAVERRVLSTNPLPSFKWSPPKASGTIDRRVVVNPVQARTLLHCVQQTRRSGPRLYGFFALLYFAGLRPEEAANVRVQDLTLPSSGWGAVHLRESTPYAGSDWTNDGRQRDTRQLKNRAAGEGRPVPCPPELVAILRAHLATFGAGPGGRLFVGERADELPKLTYLRAWRAARGAAFTPEAQATPLARTPYDLRHACVSTWLNGGVPAPQVAVWAGHSVEVLLKIYAKCLDGHEGLAKRHVEAALGYR
jgi:integrase